jgi:thiol-disulfide isomerase/thioredoxin
MISRRLPLLLLFVAAALPLTAQQIPADPVLRDFEPLGSWVLEVGGATLPGVRLFQSQRAGSAILATGQGIPGALLIVPRSQEVQRLPATKAVVGTDGIAYVLADAQPVRESALVVAGDELRFTVGGKQSRLKEMPYLLGLHPAADLRKHDVSYAFRAGRYTPSAPVVRALRSTKEPVRVRVYFGSWCPHCSVTVPKILKLNEALAGTPIQFEYYGLPKGFGTEPAAIRDGIDTVPTGVVFRNGKVIGRINGHEWAIPEMAVKKVLDGAARASR